MCFRYLFSLLLIAIFFSCSPAERMGPGDESDNAPPAMPRNFSAITSSSKQIDLSWIDDSVNENGFHVYYSNVNTLPGTVYHTEDAGVTNTSITNLDSDTTYYFWIEAFNTFGKSPSNFVTGTTAAPPITLPDAPSGLSLTPSNTSMHVSWKDNSNNEEKFNIYMSTANSKPSSPTDSSLANVTNIVIHNLSYNTTYYFWAEAQNAIGKSLDVSGSKLSSQMPAPIPPSAFSARIIKGNKVKLAWSDKSDNETGFNVYVSTSSTKPTTPTDTTGANALNYTTSVLTKGRNYYFWVEAFNGGGISSHQTKAIHTFGDKTFNAKNILSDSNYLVASTLMYVGDHCLVYVENANSQRVSSSQASSIGTEFDNNIYDLITSKFAPMRDVDGNERVILLLMDIQDGYGLNGRRGYVAGYFYAIDQFSRSSYRDSNEADMFYIDINPLAVASSDSYETIAHEFQHLVHFQKKYGDHQVITDTWVNEGLSTAAEHLYKGGSVTSKINYYNRDINYDGRIANGRRFIFWQGIFENYVTDYIFFQWLTMHSSAGNSIYKNIINSSHGDAAAVITATSIGSSWEAIYSKFSAALLRQNGSGIYGFKNRLGLKGAAVYNTAAVTVSLRPGENIYVFVRKSTDAAASFYFPNSGNIKYFGFNTKTYSFDFNGYMYDGHIISAYNSSTDEDGADEDTATFPGRYWSLNSEANLSKHSSPPSPGAFPIGVSFNLDGKLEKFNRENIDETMEVDLGPPLIYKKQ